MAKIEYIFKNVERYEIFTGYKDEKNLYLYQKLGYKKFKFEKVNETLFFEYLEKVNEI
jgi:hypothetical protein